MTHPFPNSNFYQKKKEESFPCSPCSALQNVPKSSFKTPAQSQTYCKQQSDYASFSVWDAFPLKYHPEVLSDSEEDSGDEEEFKEFMKKYNTELLTSDTDETTDDDEDFEEFMKKLRMKTRPKLKDKKIR